MAANSIDNEKELISRCLKNDAAAQKEMYQQFAGTMYTICLRYAQHQEEAKDFLQDGFVKAFKALHTFSFKGSFEGWLKRIFVNNALEEIRKKGRLVLTETLPDTKIIEDEWRMGSKMNMQHILNCISTLPDGYRTIFNMYVIDGYSHAEISRMMGITESTSKTQLRKARLALQQKLKDFKE